MLLTSWLDFGLLYTMDWKMAKAYLPSLAALSSIWKSYSFSMKTKNNADKVSGWGYTYKQKCVISPVIFFGMSVIVYPLSTVTL